MLTRPSLHIVMGVVILILDLLTGPFLFFPILFVLPVSLCSWYCNPRLAYGLAMLLPVGRFFIAEFVEHPHPLPYIIINGLIRMMMLLFLAYLVGRTARQTRELEERVAGLVKMCAWSRTLEYQGEWISFEEYLKRRFDIDTSHGISPTEAEKAFGGLVPRDAPREHAPHPRRAALDVEFRRGPTRVHSERPRH